MLLLLQMLVLVLVSVLEPVFCVCLFFISNSTKGLLEGESVLGVTWGCKGVV